MKKVIALSSVLALGALGMACGETAPANNANKPANANANANKPANTTTTTNTTSTTNTAKPAANAPAANATKPAANAPANK